MFASGDPVVSFEFFPPKTDGRHRGALRTRSRRCKACRPSFVSVTYGAGGSTRDRTIELVTRDQT